MENKKTKKMLPFLMVTLMVFSSFAIIGAATGAPVLTEKVKASLDNGNVLVLYDNKTLANNWVNLLNDFGYNVNLLPSDEFRNSEYFNYNLIVLAMDAHALSSPEVHILSMSHKPILGTGSGGIYAYSALTGNQAFFFTSSYSNGIIAKKNLSVYRTPMNVSNVPGRVNLFHDTSGVDYVARISDLNNESAFIMGYSPLNQQYAPVVQINNFMLFGYQRDPATLTADGRNFVYNLIYYMANNHNYNVGVPRVTSRVTIDGHLGFFEWFGAKFVPLNEDFKNTTAFYEDENYLYVLMRVVNTTDHNYMTLWFERDNNRTEGVDTSVFYIYMGESSKMKYREVTGYNTWGDFLDPDGVNISGAMTWDSQYLISEWKISKTYLGMHPGNSSLMGFGIEYGLSPAWEYFEYPTTFWFKDAETALTLYSENHWKGQYESVNAKAWRVSIDGDYSSGEWHGASTYYMETMSGEAFVLSFSHDSEYLYIGGHVKNESGSSSAVYLYFDVDGNGGTKPQKDDFEIWFGKSVSGTTYASEHYGTGTDWNPGGPLTNASASFKMSGSTLYLELRIKLSKLKITPGTYREVKMQIGINSAGEMYYLPTDHDHYAPDKWNVTLYSQASWGDGTMSYDGRDGDRVSVDGVMSTGEWDNAYKYSYSTHMGKYMTVYIKTNVTDEKMYLALIYPFPIDFNNTAFEVGFDVGYDHNGAPGSGDFAMKITYWNRSLEYGFSGGAWHTQSSYGWRYASDNSTSYWTVEIEIDYSKLEITRGVDSKLGMVFAVLDNGTGIEVGPQGSTFMDTSTWNTVTTSDNWGNAVVPELGTFAVLAVLLIAGIAVIARREH